MDFSTQVRETKNGVLNRPEYAQPIEDLNRRVADYNREQMLNKTQNEVAKKEVHDEELEK